MYHPVFRSSPYCRGRDGSPKRVYPSETAAWDSAYYCMHERNIELYPYRCDQCGGWHLTKNHKDMAFSGVYWSLA
jgi:hypothetical protein